MSRSRLAILGSILAAVAVLAIAWSRGADAEPHAASHRIVYLYVSGRGAQAKAWYDGGPPSGVQVQQALDTFAGQGFRYVALGSSGMPSQVSVGATLVTPAEGALEASYVILLER